MAEKEIILELDYRISPEDFYTFSVRSMNRQYAARAKKTNFTGILKLLVGILVCDLCPADCHDPVPADE